MTTAHDGHALGCKLWADALQKKSTWKNIASLQKRGALCIESALAYPTVSESVVIVVAAGVVPIEILAFGETAVLTTEDARLAALKPETVRKQDW